ncbi:MAG TPA: hypothetical protein VEG33_20715 [Streptosporangiaceae bacterium]|nr:hypothetical protein [Streptosporangiaceae bacterium]
MPGTATAGSAPTTAGPSGGTQARPSASRSASAVPHPSAVGFQPCAMLPPNVVAGLLAAGAVDGVTDARTVPAGVLRQQDGCNYTVRGGTQTLGYLVWRYPSPAAAKAPLSALQVLKGSAGMTAFRPGLADGSLGIVVSTGSVAAVQLTVVAGDRVLQLTLGGQPTAAAAQDRATAAARQLLRRL